MTDWLPEYVQTQMDLLGRDHPHMAADMREAGGVLLYGTVGHAAYLRPDGSVWLEVDRASSTGPELLRADPTHRIAALVLGARRMPELRQLLPARPATAEACAPCAGTGLVHGGIACLACSALGWTTEGAA